MGVAVLEGWELVFWGVCGFRQKGEDALFAAVRDRAKDLVALYQPNAVALEAPRPERVAASPLLAGVVASLECAAAEAGLVTKRLAPEEVRRRLCGSARATLRDVAERLVQRFDHLERYRNCGSSWKETYWQAMFSAVALASVCADGQCSQSAKAISPR